METSKTAPIGIKQLPSQRNYKSNNHNLDYELKLNEVLQQNIKLKELMQVIRNNSLARKVEASQVSQKSQDNQNVLTLRKKKQRLMADIQHLTNSLNCLINQNNKLKSQVDSSRSSRVIYSNVYKELEKEIHHNEFRYKSTLIDLICYEETDLKVRQKIEKALRKLQKQVSELQGVSFSKKKEKRKITRVDTGLSSYRDSKLASKDTNRNSSKELKSYAALSTKRDEVVQEEAIHRKQSHEVVQSRQKAERPQIAQSPIKVMGQTNKTKMGPEEVNEYYDSQMKSGYYDRVVSQLQNLCGGGTIQEISKFWKNIDVQTEQEYQKYLRFEENLKQIQQEIGKIQLINKANISQEPYSEKTLQEVELVEVESQLSREQRQLQQLQGELTLLIDLNCHKLSDEEIHQHILRIKRRRMAHNKELDKLLESACKQKSVTNSLKSSRVGH